MTPKTIIITGASRGMGHAMAEHFYQQGHRLILIASSPESFKALQKSLSHDSTTPSPHDSTTPSSHGSTTPSSHGSTTPSSHDSTTPSPHGSTTPSPHGSTTPSSHDSTTPSSHDSTTPSSHGSTTPSSHGLSVGSRTHRHAMDPANKSRDDESFENDVIYVTGNFDSFDAIENIAKTIKQHTDHADVLINNLGMYTESPLIDAKKTDFFELLDVNFRGPAYFTQQMLPLLQKGAHAQIINTSSIAVKQAIKNTALYSASKAAVTAFSNALRKELNPLGIRLTVLHPGGVNTWNATDNKGLLRTSDIVNLVQFIVNTDPKCQLDEVTVTAV